jgi:hypothetical protein
VTYTIGVDFDGVIHRYSKGWHDGSIYDPPVPDALDSLRTIMVEHAVFVFTARPVAPVAEWLIGHGLPATTNEPPCFWSDRTQLLVTNRKFPAFVYIDDRAVRFETWPQTLTQVADLISGRR